MKKIYEYDDEMTVGGEYVPIDIVKGPYKGTKVLFGEVSFQEDEITDSVKVSFQYEILEKSEDLIEDRIFTNQLGEIITDILQEELKEVEDDFLRSGLPLGGSTKIIDENE